MKLTLQNTEQIVALDPTAYPIGRARVWVGTTDTGIPIQALIVRVAVEDHHSQEAFERELQEKPAPPPELPAFPLRMML